jgi:hypothetical protein
MKIVLTPAEAEDIFYNSLCNAVGTGYMEGYGLRLQADRSQYKNSREHLERLGKDTCYEDVLMQILRDGGSLTFVDIEGDGDMTRSITMKEVHERVEKIPISNLCNIHEETDDAADADIVLQTVFYEEVIFG